MKYLNLSFLIIFFPLVLSAQTNNTIATPRIDKRVELLSIVFRLAGNEEYNTPDNVKYVADIHKHLDKFIDHPLIKYARELRDSSGVSYDAVMSMAVHLNEPPALEPLVPFSVSLPDKRWTLESAVKFTALLKQFYKDADFDGFFHAHLADYAIAESRFNALFKKLDVSWYYKFYGKAPAENFNIIIGFGNGGGNYGPHVYLNDHTKKVYAIIGSGTFDEQGLPTYDAASYLPTLIHEFNHSFINYLTDNYESQLRDAGALIYEKERTKMRKQAYGEWKTMMNEALVRASVISYLKTHNTDTLVAEQELKQQLARGFVWMRPLVNLLGKYQSNRKTYPTLESFMPAIVVFYNKLAPNISFYDDDYQQHCARVIAVRPFKNGDTTIRANTTEIIFDFDKKLDGIKYFFGPGARGIDHYPKSAKFTFANDNKSIIMKVSLKPNTEYQINITGGMMRASDGYAVQNYILNFKTENNPIP
ncbi:DUF4932 domain-containing protein [Mucilaginibacter sp. P25]|uniref:DUF4932 domain-containing protein n=1 Tax=Mucilaginibacter gossypii TaxID=551996 RepID=A0A1G8KA09_9SPHI|nr:DUF4932 domain-containing protein [Mucilaginibacter gossypii]SDI40316.1 protein of unknown function [Mucilaginibacter gossypii]